VALTVKAELKMANVQLCEWIGKMCSFYIEVSAFCNGPIDTYEFIYLFTKTQYNM